MTKRPRKLKLTVGEPEPDSALICLAVTVPLARPENLCATCSDCGAGIQYHPTSPNVARKLCMRCAGKQIGEPGAVKGARITQSQLDFVRLATWKGGTKQ